MHDEIVRKPLCVSLTRLMLVWAMLTVVIAVAMLIYGYVTDDRLRQTLSFFSLLDLSAAIGLGWLLWYIYRGLERRKRYSQWLGAIFLVAIAIIVMSQSSYLSLIGRSIGQFQPLPAPPYDCWQSKLIDGNVQRSCGYSSYPNLALLVILDLLMPMAIGFVAVRLLLGRAAKRYFRA
jgi:hypothetical protein